MANIINIVGVGPGAKDFLTPVAMDLIKQADILVGGQRNLELFADLKKEQFIIRNNLSEMIDFLRSNYHQKKITLLASGDPGLFGIVSYMSKHFTQEDFYIIPGISSVQLAFARLQMPWQDAVILSTHGREMAKTINLIITLPKVAVLTDSKGSPAAIAKELMAAGVANKKCWVCTNLSYPDEEITEFTIAEMAASKSAGNCILVLIDR